MKEILIFIDEIQESSKVSAHMKIEGSKEGIPKKSQEKA